jgi:hypothetical protein
MWRFPAQGHPAKPVTSNLFETALGTR